MITSYKSAEIKNLNFLITNIYVRKEILQNGNKTNSIKKANL